MDDKAAQIAMMLITHAGTAKSCALEAINLAEEGKFPEANKLIEEAEASYIEAAKEHRSALEAEQTGELKLSLLLMHAEDQLLSAETVIILAKKFISLYNKVK